MARNRRFRRTLPNGVAIYVSADSRLKYLTPRFDTNLVALARDHVTADSAVWDIGANCGGFAFIATAARQVLAVGADPYFADLLRQSAGRKARKSRRGRASNHRVGAGNSPSGAAHWQIVVPTITLDALLDHFGPPTLVKIDVEGAGYRLTKAAELNWLAEPGPFSQG